MTPIGKSVIKQAGERRVVCNELSVAQVRSLLAAEQGGDLVDVALFEDMRLIDLPTFTDLTFDEIDAMLPSELAQVIEGCKEANPSFFQMLARLASHAKPL